VLTVFERVGRPVGPGASLVVPPPRGGGVKAEVGRLVDWDSVLVGVVCVFRDAVPVCVVLAVVGAFVLVLALVLVFVLVLTLVFVLVFCANAPLESRETAKMVE